MLILKILRTLNEFELSSIASKHHLGCQGFHIQNAMEMLYYQKKYAWGKKKNPKNRTAAFRVRRWATVVVALFEGKKNKKQKRQHHNLAVIKTTDVAWVLACCFAGRWSTLPPAFTRFAFKGAWCVHLSKQMSAETDDPPDLHLRQKWCHLNNNAAGYRVRLFCVCVRACVLFFSNSGFQRLRDDLLWANWIKHNDKKHESSLIKHVLENFQRRRCALKCT